MMAEPEKSPAEMSDHELIAEWECIECDSEDAHRTKALAAELKRRDVEV